jgi:hypothetical protein
MFCRRKFVTQNIYRKQNRCHCYKDHVEQGNSLLIVRLLRNTYCLGKMRAFIYYKFFFVVCMCIRERHHWGDPGEMGG